MLDETYAAYFERLLRAELESSIIPKLDALIESQNHVLKVLCGIDRKSPN